MPESAKKVETEKGFGTGLRAQLEKKRKRDEPASVGEALAAGDDAAPDPPVAGTPPVEQQPPPPRHEPEPQLEAVDPSPDLEALRAELAASLKREQELRATLADQVEAYERGLDHDKSLAMREAELEQRAARLTATAGDLDRRQRLVSQREKAVESDEGRLQQLQRELQVGQSRLAEQQSDAERRRRELAEAEKEHAKSSSELAKGAAGLEEREKRLSRQESDLARRDREAA
jgi:chromosome segregation ATPase